MASSIGLRRARLGGAKISQRAGVVLVRSVRVSLAKRSFAMHKGLLAIDCDARSLAIQ